MVRSTAKGKMLSLAFFVFVKGDGLSAKLTPEIKGPFDDCFMIAACPQV